MPVKKDIVVNVHLEILRFVHQSLKAQADEKYTKNTDWSDFRTDAYIIDVTRCPVNFSWIFLYFDVCVCGQCKPPRVKTQACYQIESYPQTKTTCF